MVKCGEALGEVGDAMVAWEAGLRDQYLGPISHVLEEDTKEYQHQKKKLENRRLDYDAKRTNLQKSKKDDKTDLENDTNAAKAKFEETVNTLRDIMAKIAANEAEEVANLEAFVAVNRRFFETGARVFANLSRTLTDPTVRGVRLVKAQSFIDTSGGESAENSASPAMGGGDDAPAPAPSSRPTSQFVAPSPTFGAAGAGQPSGAPAPVVARKPAPAAAPASAAPAAAAAVPTGNLVSLPGGAGPAPTPAPKPTAGGAPPTAAPKPTPAPAPAAAPTPAAAAPAPVAAPPPRPKPRAAPVAQDRVRALFAFTPDNDDELAFGKGDIILIVTKVDDSWYVGELNGKRGLFPSNYVAPL